MKIIPSVLLCALFQLSALAQGFGGYSSDQPYFSGLPSPSLGLLEWWSYGPPSMSTNGAAVTNWIGNILGTVLTNGNSGVRPTADNSGVVFGAGGTAKYLTNAPLSFGSNWTVVVRQKITNEGYSSSAIYPLFGENGTGFACGWGDGFDPDSLMEFYNKAPFPSGSLQLHAVLNHYIDWALVMSNHVNGTGGWFMYTNGVFVTASAAQREPSTVKFSIIGWGGTGFAANDYYTGSVKDYWIYTNLLTAAQLLDAHTNYSD